MALTKESFKDRLAFETQQDGLNRYKVGCNFDPAFVTMCDDLNHKYNKGARIVEMYGSDRAHAAISARPDFRIQDISMDQLAKTIQEGLDHDITFNYTMNSTSPYGSKVELLRHKKDVQDFVKELENIGCYRVTVATPIMAMIVREVCPDIQIEVSTTVHVDTVTQIKLWHEMFGVNKVCGNILRNRDRKFLENVATYCNRYHVIYELMINEFCYNTFNGSSTHCIFRDSCYNCHATNHIKEDAMAYNNYPMGMCIASRGNTEEGWLRSRYVLPQWIPYYNSIGLHHFKLTGRTGSIEYLTKLCEAYMSMHYDGNLLELWKPLQSIYSGKSESEETSKYMNIPCSKLGHPFISHWFCKEGFKCDDHLCGADASTDLDPTYDGREGIWHGDYACNFCWNYYNKYIKDQA